MTEEQVKAKGLAYKIGKFPFSANGRARTSGETDGFVKIIRDAKYGEILGAHIVGAHATEMIHELVVARENEFTVEEIDLAIHAHPTLSEAIAEAVLDSMSGTSLVHLAAHGHRWRVIGLAHAPAGLKPRWAAALRAASDTARPSFQRHHLSFSGSGLAVLAK